MSLAVNINTDHPPNSGFSRSHFLSSQKLRKKDNFDHEAIFSSQSVIEQLNIIIIVVVIVTVISRVCGL